MKNNNKHITNVLKGRFCWRSFFLSGDQADYWAIFEGVMGRNAYLGMWGGVLKEQKRF
jgi:hypothetical protein